MSVTECPGCGKQVARDAAQCLNCGHNFARQRQRRLRYLTYGAGATVVLLVALIGISVYVALPEKTPKRRMTRLITSVRQGEISRVESLLKAGADPNIRAEQNRTVLHVAAGSGSRNLINLLLRRGARTDLRDEAGNTAADIARENGYIMEARSLD